MEESFSGEAQDDMLGEQTLSMCEVERSSAGHDGVFCLESFLVSPDVK